MEHTSTDSTLNASDGYKIDLTNNVGDNSTVLSLSRVLYIVIVFLAFIIILLHVVVGVSMINTIFLFVLYGLLLGFISYVQYRYISK
jgi:hypothetical protein